MPHCGQGRRRVLQVDRGTHGTFDEMEARGSIVDTLNCTWSLGKEGSKKKREDIANGIAYSKEMYIYIYICVCVCVCVGVCSKERWTTPNPWSPCKTRKPVVCRETWRLTLTLITRPEHASSNPVPSAPDVARYLGRNLSPRLTRGTEEAI
jgi:hypothetical protein